MSQSEKHPLLKIDEFPFYVGVINDDRQPEVPKFLPFHLYVDRRLAIPRLVRTKKIDEALNAAYSFGSMLSTPLGESSLASERMQDFLSNLTEKIGGSYESKYFVEVGAGNGALLNAIREKGASVIGFEIGPQAEMAKKNFGLNIIRGELNGSSLSHKVDCIYSYGCLEHIYEPHIFIDIAKDVLKHGGLFFHRVPNFSSLLQYGNIQGLCHEHVNYFTSENAVRLLEARGFVNCGACPSSAGNELDIWGFADANKSIYWPGDDLSIFEKESEQLKNYSIYLENCIRDQVFRLKNRASALGDGKLGFYAGGHVLAAMAGVEEHCYFFDGDEKKWGGRWLPGLSAIGRPQDIIKDPPALLVICSEHYFESINNYLRKVIKIPETIELIPLSEI
jgi:SAM-dependent methyltransferase